MLNYSVSCQGSMFYAVKVSERRCLFCKKPVMGRADKKFCDSDCRSSHYNQLHRASNNFIRKINRRLTRNRRILKELNPEGKTTVHRSEEHTSELQSRGHLVSRLLLEKKNLLDNY